MARVALSIHPFVFTVTASVTVIFVTYSLLNLSETGRLFQAIQAFITQKTGWFFVLTVNLYLGTAGYLMFSRYGSIRLGGKDAKPEFSYWSWFAMLFSAGMGIGLLFYSVAEPMYHYLAPPMAKPRTIEAAREAMSFTFFHWGLHAWGIYACIGLALAFFSYNRGLPLTIRSTLFPILGRKIYGGIGNTVDSLSALATLFGLATSLGLGVQQINAGLHHLFGLQIGPTIQVLLISVITLLATTSVVLGVDKGIRRLSELNIWAGLALLLFVLFASQTVYLLDAFIQNIGMYVSRFIAMSTWREAYQGTNWEASWTVFYWAWWISWSPFVGTFIARVSKGRTIKEFLAGVLFAPTLLTFAWLSVFGNAALYQEIFLTGGIADAVQENLSLALFLLLEKFPMAGISSILAVMVVATFFITSSDSASLVVDIITSGGAPNPPIWQRIFWSCTEGALAIVLLLGGGLQALQTAAVAMGLPFAVVLFLVLFGLLKGLKKEKEKMTFSHRTRVDLHSIK
ncbi:MAG: BCCT family transporter [Chloroherpetonaceae bacterium]